MLREIGPMWQLRVGGLTLKLQPYLSLKAPHSDKYVHNGLHLNYNIKPIIGKMHRPWSWWHQCTTLRGTRWDPGELGLNWQRLSRITLGAHFCAFWDGKIKYHASWSSNTEVKFLYPQWSCHFEVVVISPLWALLGSLYSSRPSQGGLSIFSPFWMGGKWTTCEVVDWVCPV